MKRVPIYTIRAAKESDTDAIKAVIWHFRSYITFRCLSHRIGADGHDHIFVDVDLWDQAISALLSAIFTFRLKELPSSFLTTKSPRPWQKRAGTFLP